MNRIRIRSSNFRAPTEAGNIVRISAFGRQDTTGYVAFGASNSDVDAHGRQDTTGYVTFQFLRSGLQDTSGRVTFRLRFHGLQDTTGAVTFAGQVATAYLRTFVVAPMPDVTAITLTDYPVENAVTADWLKTVANGGLVKNASAFDVVMQTEAGVSLDHEKLAYDGAVGTLRYALRIPSWLTSQKIPHVVRYGG